MSRDQFRDRLVRGKRKGKRVYRAQQEVQNKSGQKLKGYVYCLTRDKESASFFAVVLSFFCFFFCFLLLTFPICSVFVFCFVLFIFFLSSWDLFIFCLFSFFVFCLRDGFCFLLFRFLFVLFPVPPDQAICNNEPQSILVTFSPHYYSA